MRLALTFFAFLFTIYHPYANATQADAYMGLILNILSADGLIAPGGRLSRKGR
jgi:hypothetical protein